MIKYVYDFFDAGRKIPFPNLWSDAVRKHNSLDVEKYPHYNFDYNTQDFFLHTCHSEFCGNMVTWENIIVLEKTDVLSDNDTYFYPIEIFGNHRRLLKTYREKNKFGEFYTTSFVDNVSEMAVTLAKKGKLTFVINYSHEPFSDMYFLQEFSKEIKSLGLDEDNFIFFVGTSNLYDLHPTVKRYNFKFFFEDNLILSTAKKAKELKYNPNYALGYETTWFSEHEVFSDKLRGKHFVCPNRNSAKAHRFTIGCFFESRNLWENIYASFLRVPDNGVPVYKTSDPEFNKEIVLSAMSFINKIPIEFDTQNSNDKESFESFRAFKKEVYLDSYIHIVTETNFDRDIFITEKIFNPMVVLQPFIVFGAHGYLKYLQNLGFKTFHPFIDESYDNEKSGDKRYLMLCSEIDRLSSKSLSEIHDWYNSISEVLIHNRNHLLTFADKTMFRDNINRYVYGTE